MNELINFFKDDPNVTILINCDLTLKSTMKLKARGNLIQVKSLDALKRVVLELNNRDIKYSLLGLGANQYLPEHSDIPYLKLNLPFDKNYLKMEREEYSLPASLSLSKLTSHAIQFGNIGWESFTGIPATLGGAVFMNAGTSLGEIGPLIKEVHVVDREGREKKILMDKTSFSYRKNHFLSPGEVIYQLVMKDFGKDLNLIPDKIKNYLEFRTRTQPLDKKTCGCLFKNKKLALNSAEILTCPAGKFIDIMGLKGLTYNDLRISPKHGNFLENTGSATLGDVEKFARFIQKELELEFGIEFDTEVRF